MTEHKTTQYMILARYDLNGMRYNLEIPFYTHETLARESFAALKGVDGLDVELQVSSEIVEIIK